MNKNNITQNLLTVKQRYEQRKSQEKYTQHRKSVDDASSVLATSIWDQRDEQDNDTYSIYIGRKPDGGFTADYLLEVADAALLKLEFLGMVDVIYNDKATEVECRRTPQGYGNRIGDYDRNNLWIVCDRLPLASLHQIAEARTEFVTAIAQAV